jgi:hypothetical protein
MLLVDWPYGNNAAVTAIKEVMWAQVNESPAPLAASGVSSPEYSKDTNLLAPLFQGGGMLLRLLFDNLAQLLARGNALAPTIANTR